MAKFNDEERKKLAKNIALYIIDENNKGNKVTTRSLAKIFNISNYTVSILMGDYLLNIDSNLYNQVYPIIKSNRSSISDKNIKMRVLKEAELVVKGYKYSDIIMYFQTSDDVMHFSLTESIIHHDLNVFLPQIDKDLYTEVKLCLEKHSYNNLIPGNEVYINQERDISGRFK